MSRSKHYNLIIADDDSTIGHLLKLKSEYYGFRPLVVKNGAEVLQCINDSVEVVLLDIAMPVMDGVACLQELTKKNPHVSVVMLSGENDAETVMRCVKLGAHDYITKPFDMNELFTTLRHARKACQMERENQSLKESATSLATSGGLIAESAEMKSLLIKAEKVAQRDSSLLLTGESGTGKGVLARYIHSHSPRAHMPFVTVSCPALPRELLESELFGHEKGAFTGALKKRIGKIAAAQGGTLFLDEIGDLPIDLQPKLLNVLQDKVFYPVGSEQAVTCDVRIITATHADFEQQIKAKQFREDLYYRISVIPLRLPALRDRPDEIMPLAEHFARRVANKHQVEQVTFSEKALEKLMSYSWPGNVRQLENSIERASVFCESAEILPEDLTGGIDERDEGWAIAGESLAGKTLTEVEKSAIEQTLSLCGGNKAKCARMLGISEKSIYNKMKHHGLM